LKDAPDATIAFLPLKVRAVGRVMRAGRAAGFTGTFLGGDGWGNLELLAAGGRAATGSFFASHWNPAIDQPTSLAFFERYLTENKREPSLGAALGYDAARALFQVIRDVGTDHAKIRDALAALKDFPSTTGPLEFDADRSAVRNVVILRVEVSRFTPEQIVPPPAPVKR
jgi:branched-chain amino acid transport system substrate-binding protein